MKKIVIIFNHFQIQDGVARSAIGIANALTRKPGVEVTIRPLFRFDKTMLDRLDNKVIVRPVFKHYFRGMSKILSKIPIKLLRKWIIGDEFDVEVGLCMSLPIKIVAASSKNVGSTKSKSDKKNTPTQLAWMHCYDTGLTLRSEYEAIGKVICVSKSNADRLRAEAGTLFDVDYAYNLLDDKEIKEKGEESIQLKRSQYTQFISVGRLSPEKGYMRLLEICKVLKDDGYRFNLWLVGDGPQKTDLQEKAMIMGLENSVLFLGQQTNPHAFTSKADVFICSSFDEGYSTACTEAIILGIPVITTDVSGGQEIIDEANCGLIVPKYDDDALYQAMKSVLDKPLLIDNWKKELSITSERFSYKNRANKLYKLFGLE